MRKVLNTTILLVLAQFCHAQDFWIELERPTGGMVFSLAVSSKTEVYAGMGNGVYLSNDDSNSWILTGLEGITSYSLHIYQNGHVFAGTGGFNALYRMETIEDGWIPLISSLGGNIVSIMHTTSGDLHFGFWGGIYKSTDFGETWTQVLELDNTQVIKSIVENTDGVLFAGVTAFLEGGGVYRSADSGDTWEQIGLPNKYVRSLAVNSLGDIFAGSVGDHYLYYGGLYKSTDNGGTWVELRNDVLVTSIVITPDDHIYFGSNEYGDQAGVFFSNDHGETWERIISGLIGPSNQKIEGLSLAPDGYLYAYGNHLHRSVNPVFDANAAPLQEADDLTVFPNPFIDFLHFQFSSNKYYAEDYSVKVFDPLGRMVFSQELGGLQDGTINLSSLPQGMYYISVEINGQRYAKPILKVLR